MTLFSEREGLTSRQEIVDTAPDWLRRGFYIQVLEPVLYLDRSSNSFASSTDSIRSPIGVKAVIEKISTFSRISPPFNYRADALSFTALENQLLELPWFHFYNSIELVSELLQGQERSQGNRSYGIRYFQSFQNSTNLLFEEGAVGWRLNESGKLQRKLPVEIFNLESTILSTNPTNPIAVHIAKAKGFLNQHPCDAANTIKESISAVESLARTLSPSAKTLGDVVNKLRNSSSHPPLLLSAIEKLYAFACDEPAVRHGSAQEEKVTRNDAEFVFVTSLAVIRYLQEAGN